MFCKEAVDYRNTLYHTDSKSNSSSENHLGQTLVWLIRASEQTTSASDTKIRKMGQKLTPKRTFVCVPSESSAQIADDSSVIQLQANAERVIETLVKEKL